MPPCPCHQLGNKCPDKGTHLHRDCPAKSCWRNGKFFLPGSKTALVVEPQCVECDVPSVPGISEISIDSSRLTEALRRAESFAAVAAARGGPRGRNIAQPSDGPS
mmetsp:Transcript_10455/g.22744  ORF Transcript_10455/g.22744 Transcript_10455/m.22744 type:complete len:105 (-) Transcript_10455:438-752(-)